MLLRSRMTRAVRLVLLTVMAVVGGAAGQASFKITSAGPPPVGISAKLRQQLQAEGTRLLHSVRGIDTPLCDLWWAKNIPASQRGNAGPGIVYGELLPGSFMGVIHLPGDLEDSYHQKLAAGYYTLRYARVSPPVKGREKKEEDDDDEPARNSATNLDVVLLSRSDTDAGVSTIPVNRLLELAKATARGKQAARMRLLALNPAYRTFPALVSDDLGNCAVQFRLFTRTSGGKTEPLAISILLFILPDFGAED